MWYLEVRGLFPNSALLPLFCGVSGALARSGFCRGCYGTLTNFASQHLVSPVRDHTTHRHAGASAHPSSTAEAAGLQ